MTSMGRQSSEFSCAYCSAGPRNPCYDAEDVSTCPNASPETKDYARSRLPGYSRSEADELAEYRRRYGALR